VQENWHAQCNNASAILVNSRFRAVLVLAVGFIIPPTLACSAEIEWRPNVSGDSSGWSQASAIKWLRTCGSPKEDWINRIIELSGGSILAVGYIGRDDAGKEPQDWTAVALKFSEAGRLVWSSAFGGSAIDAAWSVHEMPDHGLVLGGFSSSDSAGGLDAYLVVLNADGHVEIEKRFGGPKDDRATDVLLTRDGSFLLIGETRSIGAGERDVLLIKTDRHGKEIWRKPFGGPEMDRGFAGVETRDGDFVIIGATGSDHKHDGLVLKVDANGNQIWRTLIHGDKNVTPHFVNLLSDGRILVIGYTDSWGATVNDYFAATISLSGSIEKLQTLGGKDDDRAMTSVSSSRGDSWIVGYSKSFGSGDWDILIAQVGADGTFGPDVIPIGTAEDDNGTTIAEARNGDLLIGGYTKAPSHGKDLPDLFVMRFDPKKAQRTSKGVVIKTIR
jgi:hypothetical protein